MDFRVLALSMLLWLVTLNACANSQLDELTEIIYQYPTKAFNQIATLEKQPVTEKASDIDQLRLSILKCQNLLQLGKIKPRLISPSWVKQKLND